MRMLSSTVLVGDTGSGRCRVAESAIEGTPLRLLLLAPPRTRVQAPERGLCEIVVQIRQAGHGLISVRKSFCESFGKSQSVQ